MYKNGIYETISFGKSEKVPEILVLKEFYLKKFKAIIEFQRIAFV
jgi:hypothetical protein